MCVTGAISWLMAAELFLQEARPVAVTIATIVNWLANFVVGLAFPYILVSPRLSLSLSLSLSCSLLSPPLYDSYSPMCSNNISLPLWHCGVYCDIFYCVGLSIHLPAGD